MKSMKINLRYLRKLNYRHYICAALSALSIVLTFTVFPEAFTRIGESFRDLWTSLCYYFRELLDLDVTIAKPTVNEYSAVPWKPVFGLPETWEKFKEAFSQYWSLFFSADNFTGFMKAFGEGVSNISRILLLAVVPLILIFILAFRKYLNTRNNDYNKDSAPLRFFKKAASITYIPVKRWVCSFVQFLEDNPKHYYLWIIIWVFNFNGITIIVEFIAYYLYFVISFDFISLYRQVYKLFVDLTAVISFIPTLVWIFIAYFVFCKIRAGIAYGKLRRMERHNRGFITDRPIVYMVCGTMGKKKTTAITDMLLTQEVMFRDKASVVPLHSAKLIVSYPGADLTKNKIPDKNPHGGGDKGYN